MIGLEFDLAPTFISRGARFVARVIAVAVLHFLELAADDLHAHGLAAHLIEAIAQADEPVLAELAESTAPDQKKVEDIARLDMRHDDEGDDRRRNQEEVGAERVEVAGEEAPKLQADNAARQDWNRFVAEGLETAQKDDQQQGEHGPADHLRGEVLGSLLARHQEAGVAHDEGDDEAANAEPLHQEGGNVGADQAQEIVGLHARSHVPEGGVVGVEGTEQKQHRQRAKTKQNAAYVARGGVLLVSHLQLLLLDVAAVIAQALVLIVFRLFQLLDSRAQLAIPVALQ